LFLDGCPAYPEQNGIIPGLVTGKLEKIARAKLEKIGINH
jgi:hypothetical protein